MSCEFKKSMLMDYLYDELSENERKDFETHLSGCAVCKAEIEQLHGTRSLLSIVPQEEPGERFVFTQSVRRSFAEWWRDVLNVLPRATWARATFATAAAALVLLIAGSLGNFEMKYANNEMTVSMGVLPKPSIDTVNMNDEIKQAVLAQIRQEAPQLVADILAEEKDNQRKEWEAALAEFSQAYDEKRSTDLQRLGISLDEYLQSSNNRMSQNERLLNQLMRTVSASQK